MPVRLRVLFGVLCLSIIAYFAMPFIRNAMPRPTVASRIRQYGSAARKRLAPYFQRAGVEYPPARLTLAALKHENVLQLYAPGPDGTYVHLRTYPILAASGVLGPKLREGDLQVPEGLYRITLLNPNSISHLSLRTSYPNDFDKQMGQHDGRTNLGGDIMIHGSNTSIGCLAMGDVVAEELFVLAYDTGLSKISLIISPLDFRASELPAALPVEPAWVETLYPQIREALQPLPRPKE